MRIWTIQTVPAWRILRKKGLLQLSDSPRCEPSRVQAYDWMRNQMCRRIGPAPNKKAYPLWGWYQWEAHKHKPDLRARGHVPPGAKAVRMLLEMDDTRVLLSEFTLWHFVLNNMYLPVSEADDHKFEAKWASSTGGDRYQKAVSKNWERVFDLRQKFPLEAKDIHSIQATFWQIRLSNVLEVTPFTGR